MAEEKRVNLKAKKFEAYIQKIGSELADTMAMCGVSSLAEITRDCVRV